MRIEAQGLPREALSLARNGSRGLVRA